LSYGVAVVAVVARPEFVFVATMGQVVAVAHTLEKH
jgi:hypothetical protein